MGTGRVHDYKKQYSLQEMELVAEFNDMACISDFKMLTLASELMK